MATQDDIIVQEHTVKCDGGGLLGHPRVYLEMGNSSRIECPYCGQAFIYQAATRNKMQGISHASNKRPSTAS